MEYIRRNMAAAEMKANEDATVEDEIDVALHDASPEPERRLNAALPSFKGRLNLNDYAFQQRTTPLSRNRPAPNGKELKPDNVRKEQSFLSKKLKGSRNKSSVLPPAPVAHDACVTVKREVKVEREVEVVTAPASKSDQVAIPTKVEKVEPNSPLLVPIQSTEWDLPIMKVPKSDQSSRESSSSADIAPLRRRRFSSRQEPSVVFNDGDKDDVRDRIARLPSAQSGVRAVPAVKRPTASAPARPGPSVVSAAQSPFFAASSSISVTSPSKRPSDLSSCGSPAKKARTPSSYKPPETYAHLQELDDIMAPDLLGIFVGVNPGLRSAAAGHSYAGPSNRFWKLLHTSGITERRLSPQEDTTLPEKYQFGNTNIVDRPTRNQMELSKHEMVDSVQALIDKVRKWKPESVVIVGKKIWEIIFSVRHGRSMKRDEFNYGWQPDSERMGTPKSGEKETTVDGKPWKGAMVFVATSTSGAAATPPASEKERIWRELGEWVNRRREERGLTHYPPGPTYQKVL